jgi:hypothetical protein
MSTKLSCPNCSATLQVLQPPPVGTRIKCPKCNQVFAATSLPVARPQVAPPPVPVASRGQEAPPPFRPAPERNRESDDDQTRPRRKSRRGKGRSTNTGMILIVGGVVALILVFGIIVAIALTGLSKKETAAGAPPSTDARPANPRQDGGQMSEDMLQRSIAQFPSWEPDAGAADGLGDEITVASAYTIRLPKDFTDKANGDRESGRRFTWTRKAKSGSDAATITLNIRSASGSNPLQVLSQLMNDRSPQTFDQTGVRDLQVTGSEMGRVGGFLAVRTRCAGTSAATQKKLKVVVYTVHMRDSLAVVSAFAPDDDVEGFAAAEAAALTVRKK